MSSDRPNYMLVKSKVLQISTETKSGSSPKIKCIHASEGIWAQGIVSEKVNVYIKEVGPPCPEAWSNTSLDVSMKVSFMELVKQGLFCFQWLEELIL